MYYKIGFVSWQNENIKYEGLRGLYVNEEEAQAMADRWNEKYWMVDDRRAVVVKVGE